MRQKITLVRNGKRVDIDDRWAARTLLDYLRLGERATGTKEGCCEGDCGACTVGLGRLKDGRLVYEPVNACILLTGMADGAEVVTVEDIGSPAEPHPIQEAIARHHASQCGFCTPGFVMSLFCLFHEAHGPVPRSDVNDWIAGNLCRCTGYRPIVDAAIDALSRPRQDGFRTRHDDTEKLLAGLEDTKDLFIGDDTAFFAAPHSVDALADLYARHPDATLVAGATDVGLWMTKALRDLPKLIWLGRVDDLHRIEEMGDSFLIGATATYADAEGVLSSIDSDVSELLRRLGSKQVRASGTIGGNIANGSPIGDMPPLLIALGATLELRAGDRARTVALEDFFIDYGKQDRGEGEFVTGILVPKLAPGRVFRCHKISKRFDQDISSVMGAFSFSIDDGILSDPIVAFGGMAGVPKRARAAEAALHGADVRDPAGWQSAVEALAEDFTPLSDHRASASYRMETARALLGKALAEISGVSSATTRIRGIRTGEAALG